MQPHFPARSLVANTCVVLCCLLLNKEETTISNYNKKTLHELSLLFDIKQVKLHTKSLQRKCVHFFFFIGRLKHSVQFNLEVESRQSHNASQPINCFECQTCHMKIYTYFKGFQLQCSMCMIPVGDIYSALLRLSAWYFSLHMCR